MKSEPAGSHFIPWEVLSMDMHIAENLKRLRRAKDMTQEELAA